MDYQTDLSDCWKTDGGDEGRYISVISELGDYFFRGVPEAMDGGGGKIILGVRGAEGPGAPSWYLLSSLVCV